MPTGKFHDVAIFKWFSKVMKLNVHEDKRAILTKDHLVESSDSMPLNVLSRRAVCR